MKKIIVILLMVFLPIDVYAGIYGNIEIGMPIGDSHYYTYGTEIKDYSETYFTNFAFGYKNIFLDLIEYRVYACIFTWSNGSIGKYEGQPFENIYGLGGKLVFKGFYCRYNHYCAHPSIYDSREATYTANRYYVTDEKSWVLNISSISIGYEFEIK